MSAFTDLLDRLSPYEPRYGWSHARQIPELTDEDVAIVLAECDDMLADAVTDMTLNTVLTAQLRSRNATHARYAFIGAALVHELESLARRYLIGELWARAASHVDDEVKERLHREWQDQAAEDAGVPRVGEIP